jgi:hypothetical protein
MFCSGYDHESNCRTKRIKLDPWVKMYFLNYFIITIPYFHISSLLYDKKFFFSKFNKNLEKVTIFPT